MHIRKRISLRDRIYIILGALLLITFLGGLVMVWYSYNIERLFTQIIHKDMEVFHATTALEAAILNHRIWVSYYFLDGNPVWLRHAREHRRVFRKKLEEVRALVDNGQPRATLDSIESHYARYIKSKDRVIALYQAGDRTAGSELNKQVRNQFFKLLQLCEDFEAPQRERIRKVMDGSRSQAKKLRFIAGTAILLVLVLGLLLAFVLIGRILQPVHRLLMEAEGVSERRKSADEVKALSRSVHGLIEDFDYTSSELERSRETLLQSEKMALVGRLAANMAHSIRNPLTSVKMRLFSLDRTLDLTAAQKEDFGVISEQIRHIDTNVRNFLEFSRPPKLKLQKISPSEVVDLTLQLVKHRAESCDAEIKLHRKGDLPELMADPEQLEEVLVNLIVNSCEAMERGGSIEIREEETFVEDMGWAVVIRVTDNGPGIDSSIKDKVFHPFFTTKKEGTGLGLSIASRILRDHGGRLEFTSKAGEGTTFIITLPAETGAIH